MSKTKIKYYIRDEFGNKMFLNEESNDAMNDLNKIKKVLEEARAKSPSKNDFKVLRTNESNKIV